jgi:hypothetical protein
MTVADLKVYVLVETPCYLFKRSLAKLESDGRIKVRKEPIGRKPKTYPDDSHEDILIEFPKTLFGTTIRDRLS